MWPGEDYLPLDVGAYGLGLIGDKRAVEPLIESLDTSRAVTRGDFDLPCEAAHSLGRLGDERALDPLITMLGNGQYDVAFAAAQGLVWIGEKAAGPLSKAVTDSEFRHKHGLIGAFRALGLIADMRTFPDYWKMCRRFKQYHEVIREIHAAHTRILSQLPGPEAARLRRRRSPTENRLQLRPPE